MSRFFNATVVLNHRRQFLQSDRRTWGTTSGSPLATTYAGALRLVRAMPAADRLAGVYLVTGYGYASENWSRVDEFGGLQEAEPIEPPAGVTVL